MISALYAERGSQREKCSALIAEDFQKSIRMIHTKTKRKQLTLFRASVFRVEKESRGMKYSVQIAKNL